jgi:hypothetical protein
MTLSPATRRWIWIAVLAGSTLGFSVSFACAMPFAALATLAALGLRRRDATAALAVAWIGNQVVGYGLLGYPRTFESIGWGVAIGVATLLAFEAARAGRDFASLSGGLAMAAVAFAAAFVAYEGALLAATLVLPGSDAAFSAAVVGYVLQTNLLGLAVLALIRLLIDAAGLPAPRPA